MLQKYTTICPAKEVEVPSAAYHDRQVMEKGIVWFVGWCKEYRVNRGQWPAVKIETEARIILGRASLRKRNRVFQRMVRSHLDSLIPPSQMVKLPDKLGVSVARRGRVVYKLKFCRLNHQQQRICPWIHDKNNIKT